MKNFKVNSFRVISIAVLFVLACVVSNVKADVIKETVPPVKVQTISSVIKETVPPVKIEASSVIKETVPPVKIQ